MADVNSCIVPGSLFSAATASSTVRIMNNNNEQEPSPKKQKQSALDTAPGEEHGVLSKRSPNFVRWEDEALCKAWVSTLRDPTVGSNQKGVRFWRKVQEKYKILHDQEDIEVKVIPFPRDGNQLGNRFMRHIKVDLTVFNKYYKQIKDEYPSDHTENEFIDMACERYLEFEGKPFRFKGCVPILHQLPKFSPTTGRPVVTDRLSVGRCLEDASVLSNDENGHEELAAASTTYPSGRNSIGSVMGDTLPQPITTNTATTTQKEQAPSNGALREMAASMADLVEKIDSQDLFEKRRDVVIMYTNLGMVEEAKKMATRIANEVETLSNGALREMAAAFATLVKTIENKDLFEKRRDVVTMYTNLGMVEDAKKMASKIATEVEAEAQSARNKDVFATDDVES